MSRSTRLSLLLVVALYGVSFLWGVSVDHDEGEHLHSAWLVSQGLLPFIDFFQTHSPMLWIVAAPLLAILPPGGAVMPVFRLVSVLLLALSILQVVRIARRVNGRDANDLLTAFLCLGIAGSTELFCFRPDLVANVLSLAAIALLTGSVRPRSSLLSGLLLGLAVSFNPKQAYLLAVLPLAGLALRMGARRLFLLVAANGVGVLAGLLPLVAWLGMNGLFGAFIDAVFVLNARLHAGTWLSSIGFSYGALALCASAGVALIVRRAGPPEDAGSSARRVSGIALAAACLAFVFKPGPLWAYNMQMCGLLAAPLATPVVSRLLAWLGSRWRLLPWVAAAALFLVDVARPYRGGDHPPHMETTSTIGTLGRLAGDDPVVAMTPYHPIFNRDATALYSSWQWKWRVHPEVGQSLKAMADQIIAARPSLVLAVWGNVSKCGSQVSRGQTLPSDLVQSGILSPEGGGRLASFLESGYRLVDVSGMPFWVRRDIEVDASLPRLELVD